MLTTYSTINILKINYSKHTCCDIMQIKYTCMFERQTYNLWLLNNKKDFLNDLYTNDTNILF